MDWDTGHNCLANLLLLSRTIHNYISNQTKPRCPFTGKFMSASEYTRCIGPRVFRSSVLYDEDVNVDVNAAVSYFGEF